MNTRKTTVSKAPTSTRTRHLAMLALPALLLGCASPAFSQTVRYDVRVPTTSLSNSVNEIELAFNLGGGSVGNPVGVSPSGSHSFDLGYSSTGIHDHFSTIASGSGGFYEAQFDAPAGTTFSDGLWLLNGDSMALASSVTLTLVPEPSTVALLGLTLAGAAVRRKHK